MTWHLSDQLGFLWNSQESSINNSTSAVSKEIHKNNLTGAAAWLLSMNTNFWKGMK